MNVLYVTQVYWPYLEKGGQVVKVHALARHMAERGHSVTVLTAHLGPASNLPHLQNAAETSPGIFIVWLPSIARIRTLTVNPSVIAFCKHHLHRFEIVHIFGLYDLLGPIVAWFCRRAGLPYLVEPLGMFRPIVRSLRKKRLYHRLFGRTMIQKAAGIMVNSDFERQELLNAGIPDGRILFRRDGIDLTDFDPLPPRGAFRRKLGISEEDTLFLFLGRISKKKGIDLLLKAFAQVRGSAHLAVVGPDDRDGTLQKIQKLRESLGLQDRVTLLGPLYGPQKLQTLVDADWFVLPSRSENFAIAVAEALACHTPAILSNRCGIAPWIEGRAGLVVDFGPVWLDDEETQVQHLRLALQRALDQPTLYKHFKNRCHTVARDLAWDEAVLEQVQIYKKFTSPAEML